MPRRNGRDRYRSVAQARKATDYTPGVRPSTVAANTTEIVKCSHGQPWTTCMQCSKPVARA